MYPSEALNRLALRKQLLLANSTVLRYQCAGAAATVAKPLSMVEAAAGVVRRWSPFLALASLVLPVGKAKRSVSIVGLALRWAPQLFRAVRAVSQR